MSSKTHPVIDKKLLNNVANYCFFCDKKFITTQYHKRFHSLFLQ